MIHVIITLDYEIFGDGLGDVKKHMIEPTNKLLYICDKYGAKLTIMFEIGEYWAFKNAEENNKLDLDYSPSKLMAGQAKNAIERGHDVQLHLHPQWIGANYENGYWNLNLDFWRLPNLPNGLGIKEDFFSITGALYKGKRDLEELLKPINPEYECIAFRAGGWCIQPEKDIIKAMKKVGILADTSVFEGGYVNNRAYYDFRDVVKNYGYWWTKEDNICQRGEKGKNIIEIPIYSLSRPLISNFKWTMLRVMLRISKEDKKSNNQAKQEKSINYKKILKNLFKNYPLKWDFCKLSYKDMYKFLTEAVKKECLSNEKLEIPLVMIGHSKDFFNDKNFEKFLNEVDESISKKFVKFYTFSSVIKNIRSDLQ